MLQMDKTVEAFLKCIVCLMIYPVIWLVVDHCHGCFWWTFSVTLRVQVASWWFDSISWRVWDVQSEEEFRPESPILILQRWVSYSSTLCYLWCRPLQKNESQPLPEGQAWTSWSASILRQGNINGWNFLQLIKIQDGDGKNTRFHREGPLHFGLGKAYKASRVLCLSSLFFGEKIVVFTNMVRVGGFLVRATWVLMALQHRKVLWDKSWYSDWPMLQQIMPAMSWFEAPVDAVSSRWHLSNWIIG